MKYKHEVCEGMVSVVHSIEGLGEGRPLRIRADSESIFRSRDFTKICTDRHIALEYSGPDSYWKNGRIERMWRTLNEMASCMIHHAKLDMQYYGFAFAAAAYIRNRVWNGLLRHSPGAVHGQTCTPSEYKGIWLYCVCAY